VSPVAAFRVLIVSLLVLSVNIPALSEPSETASLRTQAAAAPSNIVIGFVGGFVHHDNPHHGPVKLARQIQRTVPEDTYIRVFENRHRRQAFNSVIRLLDTNHDGILSAEERTRARIILFGHSWGASAVVALARDLRRKGVPVLLTVQVDSVAKLWQNDSVIPDNVAEAVNFYQTQGIVHGRQQITAADPAKTEILGNYRMDYKKTPVACPQATWADRFFTPGHMQSECDPTLWLQIQSMVMQRLSPSTTSAAVNSQP
jgi:pimeloyl-ACP methyl ester carboxylesterase